MGDSFGLWRPIWTAAARYSATPLLFWNRGKSGVAEYLAAAVQIGRRSPNVNRSASRAFLFTLNCNPFGADIPRL